LAMSASRRRNSDHMRRCKPYADCHQF
jgi:hypothetical protein